MSWTRFTVFGAGLLAGGAVMAQEAAPPEEGAPSSETTAQTPVATEAAPEPAASAEASGPAEDVRETYDADGNLTRRLVLSEGRLSEEVVNTYGEGGRLSARSTTAGGRVTDEVWTYDDSGSPSTHETRVGGELRSLESWTYADGRVQTYTVAAGGQTKTTTWTYDADGRVTLVETRAQDGTVLSRSVADRQPVPLPAVPINLELSGGLATDSDVRTTSITAGFSIARDVPPELYDIDHLEVSAFGNYTRGMSQGVLTNDDLSAGFGLDYNEFVKRTTAFLFMKVERNPVANLDVDLEIAPIGIKYDLVPEGGPFTLDASFAPIWNFRSILVAAGGTCDDEVLVEDGHCTFNKVRGSFRARAGLTVGPLKLKDILEFQPTLNPASGDLVAGIREEAIVKNTTSLTVKLSQRLSLASSVALTRDPLLADQVDCTADPENLLCSGLSVDSTSKLTLSMSF